MAHNLHFNEDTQKHSFFSVHQKAWHGLGQTVSDYPTSAEALRFAGLDFTVEKRKLFTCDNHNVFGNADTLSATVPVADHFATVRTDTDVPLGVVGKHYQVVQNVDAFSFFDSIVGGDGIQYETAGALGKGERIFITAKLPSYIKVGREDLVEQYLFLTTSHDGYGSITAAFTPVRIVRNNTLNAALKTCSNAVKIRHTTGAKERLEQAHNVLGIANRLAEQLEGIFRQWTTVRVTDGDVRSLIRQALAPATNNTGENNERFSARFSATCDAVFAYSQTCPTQQTDTTRGTLFGAYNAVTGYFQNVKSYRSDEEKLRSLLYGGTAQRRGQRAFDLCRLFCLTGRLGTVLN